MKAPKESILELKNDSVLLVVLISPFLMKAPLQRFKSQASHLALMMD
jgi:hypothetical protein